jgi:hypothetical protein
MPWANVLPIPQTVLVASARAALRSNATPKAAVVSARRPRVRSSVSHDVRIAQSASQDAASAMFATSRGPDSVVAGPQSCP